MKWLEELRAEMLARFPAKDVTANHFKEQFYDCNEKAAGAWEELKAKRRELAMVHTKFDDLPVETETNDAHAKQLAKLEQSDIPDYRTKAASVNAEIGSICSERKFLKNCTTR